MHPRLVGASLAFTLLCGTTPAFAQEASSASGDQTGSASIVMTAPQGNSSAAGSPQSWVVRELDDAATRVRRTRNALIGTSVGLAVGIILAGAGASQCQTFTNLQGNDEVQCNNAGNALLGTGGAIAGLSIIGMITSGAMLGVAKRNRRELEREMRRGYHGRRLQWDIPKGAWTF